MIKQIFVALNSRLLYKVDITLIGLIKLYKGYIYDKI